MPYPEPVNPNPSGVCQPGCIRLSAYLRETFSLGDSGCYNPNSRLPSGLPSFHVHGQAIDLTADYWNPTARARGNGAFAWAVAHADELNVQEIIFGPSIITAKRWREGVRTYTGGDHFNHLHLAIGAGAAASWTRPAPPKPPEVDEVEHGLAVDVAVNPANVGAGYVLDRYGGIHAYGGAKPAPPGPYWPGNDVARRLVITDWNKPAGYVLDLKGAVHPFGGNPEAKGTPYWNSAPIVPFNET